MDRTIISPQEIRALCNQGQLNSALNSLLLWSGQPTTASGPSASSNKSTFIDVETYVSLLQACGKAKALAQVKQVYLHISQSNREVSGLLGDQLVASLAKCGALDDAHRVLLSLPHRAVFPWTALISGYMALRRGREALEIYQSMQQDGVEPDHHTFASLFKACALISDLRQAEMLHADARRKGITFDTVVASTLVNLYGKLGKISQAEKAFEESIEHDVVSWTVMLSAYVKQGQELKALQLFRQMQAEGICPDQKTIVTVLQACCAVAGKDGGMDERQMSLFMPLEVARALHSKAHRMGFTHNVFVGSSLVNIYGRFGSVLEAENAFDRLLDRNAVSWCAIILGYVENGHGQEALQLFKQTQLEGTVPDQHMFVLAFQACCTAVLQERDEGVSLEIGRALHADARKAGFTLDVVLSSTLLSMYSKCGCITEAEKVFSGSLGHDVVSWNAMLSSYVEHDQGEKALQLYKQMQEEHVSPDQETCLFTLQACSRVDKAMQDGTWLNKLVPLEFGMALHADIQRKGFISNSFISNTLISMYGKCGSIEEAEIAFDKLSVGNVVSWSAMLLAYMEQGKGEQALQLYQQMQQEGVCPNRPTLVAALQACGILARGIYTVIEIGLALHTDALVNDLASDVSVSSTLVSMYGKCGCTVEAETVFCCFPWRDVGLWNAMFSAYMEQHQGVKALLLFRQMIEEGIRPDYQTFVVNFQACGTSDEEMNGNQQLARRGLLKIGQALHADAKRNHLTLKIAVSNTILCMYGKHGRVADAEEVFCGLCEPDLVLCNAMLLVYVENHHGEKALKFYMQILEAGFSPDHRTFSIVLQACSAIVGAEHGILQLFPSEIGRSLHADGVREGYASHSLVANTLVGMYGISGSIVEAENVFARLLNRDVVSFNSMLSVYMDQGRGTKALQLYRQMQADAKPDGWTFVIMLQVCGILAGKEDSSLLEGQLAQHSAFLEIGRALHMDAWRNGFLLDVYVGSSLVCMYGQCRSVIEGEMLFWRLPMHNVVVWNAMLTIYVDHCYAEKALQLYRQMHEVGFLPDQHTVVTALQACGTIADKEDVNVVEGLPLKMASLKIGQALHADILRYRFTLDSFLGGALVAMYGKCVSIVEAEIVFEGLCKQDGESWNALLSVYVEHHQAEKALQLYWKMREGGVPMNDVTILCALGACKEAGNVDACKQLHFTMVSAGYDMDFVLGRCLIRAYGACACMADGQAVFDRLSQRDVASWTACMASYAQEGNSAASLQMLQDMQLAGATPNEVTFLSLLSAFNRSGIVDKAMEVFETISRDYGLGLSIKHYATMIDLLGRAGEFEKLQNMLEQMPMPPNWAVWMCLLSSCRTYRNLELGKCAFDHAVGLKPEDATAYALMSNIYADAGLQESAVAMEELRLKRLSGQVFKIGA